MQKINGWTRLKQVLGTLLTTPTIYASFKHMLFWQPRLYFDNDFVTLRSIKDKFSMRVKIKTAGLIVAFTLLTLTTFAQTKSGQTLYTGFQYVLNADDFYPLKYSRKYSGAEDQFITTYTLYHPIKGSVFTTITATHYKSQKKVVVSVDDPNAGIFAHINSEETTYGTPSLEAFGFRGAIGAIGGQRVPNQLMVKFASNKFENIKVVHVNATEPATDNFVFYVLDEK